MRFASIGGRFALVTGDRAIDLHAASGGELPADPLAALDRWAEVLRWAADVDPQAGEVFDPRALGAPVPTPRQVFAVALNYRPHAAEAGFAAPDAPLVFTKFPSCITGPDVVVDLPEGRNDWEVELVAVIGSGGRNIPREQAWDAVAGVMAGQDISERALQTAGTPAQFSLGKSFAGFGPTGPYLVTTDELADRDDVAFYAELDGLRVQHGHTAEMIFPVDDLVCRLSAVCELWPGDLIFTGTPAGVGNRMDPPRFLEPGETLVSRFEGIGEIRQTFRRVGP